MAWKTIRVALALATALTPALAWPAALAETSSDDASQLEQGFENPPNSARPRVWWHWMNGNVTPDGIAKDLDWMKRVGIGGLQNFDANLSTPQIVENRLVYMTPEWKKAFRFAAERSEKLGLELAIAASPGWSETGGPWVPPEDGMKKLVWSETEIVGGAPYTDKLPAPPSVTGPFQAIGKPPSIAEMMSGEKGEPAPTHYADVAVLAFPVGETEAIPAPRATLRDGKVVDLAALTDDDGDTVIELAQGTVEKPALLTLVYPKAITIQSASLHLPGAAMMFTGGLVEPRLEASNDGKTWRLIAAMPATMVPTTVSFAPVTARRFRLAIAPKTNDLLAQMGAASPGAAFGFEMYDRIATSKMKIREFSLSSQARVDRYETKAGFSIEPDYYALSKGLAEAEGVAPEKVIDLTSKMRADGSLDWTPPAGRWRVVRLGYSLVGTTNHPATKEATGLEVDKFDGAAVRRYLEHYVGMYREAAGARLVGKRGVKALLTDSIEVGASNWTPLMIDRFKALRGYDPTPWLPALTGAIVDSRASSDKFLYDYRRTLADLMASEHYGVVAKVAHEQGVKVYGEALEDGRPSLGDDMAMRRHADIPMSAMWTHSREEGPRTTHVGDIRGAASVAHIYGQNLVAAESLTSSRAPWDHAPAFLKRVIDLEFVNGVNRPVIHTSVHQPTDDKVPGLSLFIFGQYFNRHESWAELAKPWVDYISRNAFMLQQGRNVADVGYFYGEDAPLTQLYKARSINDAPRAYAFDFVNADALIDALKNDGLDVVAAGGARYRALYLGGTSHKVTLKTLRRLAALAEGGATIVGLAPEGDPGHGDEGEYAALKARLWAGAEETRVGKGRVIAGRDIEKALSRLGVAPDFSFSGAGEGASIPFVHRKLSKGDLYFLVNQKDRTEAIEARFRVAGLQPELWRAETGQTAPVSYRIENGETVVPLTLAADESVYIVFRDKAAAPSLTVEARPQVSLATLDGAWDVAFQPGRGAPASATLTALAPLNENAEPGIKYFSGLATYSKAFETPAGWKPGEPLWVDLGEVREIAEVSVNGEPAGAAWHAPYKVDIGRAVKAGANRIEVRVANLWVNRLIGDAQEGAAAKHTWTSMPSYRADAPLRPSGLIGPVTLVGEAN